MEPAGRREHPNPEFANGAGRTSRAPMYSLQRHQPSAIRVRRRNERPRHPVRSVDLVLTRVRLGPAARLVPREVVHLLRVGIVRLGVRARGVLLGQPGLPLGPLATYARSDSAAFAAGLAPVAWKSENAALWFTYTPPV